LNTFKLTPREDGFEADRIMLIKDLSGNTRICSPSGSDDISCIAGSLENVDDVVDMSINTVTNQTQASLGESVFLSVTVRNNDGYDSASNVTLSVAEGIGTQWNVVDIPEGCEVDGTFITCDLGTVLPSAPGEEGDTAFEFTLQPLESGALEIPVSIDTSSVDDDQDNDAITHTVQVMDDEGTLSSLSLEFSDMDLTWVSEAQTQLVISTSNSGPADAANVVLGVTVPAGLTVSSLPAECSGTTEIHCNFDSIAVDTEVSLDFGFTPSEAGLYSVSAVAFATNHNGDPVASTTIVTVADAGTIPNTTTIPVVPVSSKSGSLVWWMLLLLSFALYVRQIHVSRTARSAD